MPIVFEEQLSKEISAGKFASVYILFGEDTYLKKYYADLISQRAYGGDPFFNLQKFEGNVELQDVYDAVYQFPMMADSKCVVLSDYDYEHASKSDLDKLSLLLAEIPQGCVLILRFDTVEFDTKKSSKAKKLLSAAEKSGGKAVQLNHRRPERLVKMLSDGATKRGCKMGDTVARHLIEIVGDDISVLKNELDKLCSFVPNQEITKEIVKLVAVKSVEASVYDYVNEIISCNISSALKMLNDIFYMRVEPMIILHTASSAYVDIYRVYSCTKSKCPISQIAKEFGYKNRAFVLERAAKNLKKLSVKQISLSFEALLEADKGLKSFAFEPRTVLEKLTVKLVYIIAKGEAVD